MRPLTNFSTAARSAQTPHRSQRWRIAIGSDVAGSTYRATLKSDLEADERVAGVIDLGAHVDQLTSYEHVALAAAHLVTGGRADRALLISGSGLGVAISANKVRGVRAVTASDSSSVQRSVLDNDAQVLCLGYRVVNLELARQLADEWLDYRFDCVSAHNVAVLQGVSGNDR